jgi:F-type H+-transporting ATPase subunit alpha
MELMKQKQYSPLTVAEMALSLFAVNEGYLDDVGVDKVGDYEAALHDYARANHGDLLDSINASGDYSDEIEAQLKSVMDGFSEKGAY